MEKIQLVTYSRYSADIYQEIKNELEKFIKRNPDVKPEVVFNPEVFEEIKRISPKNTYSSGNSTTIFGKDFSIEDSEEYFRVRKYKVKSNKSS